MLEINLLKNNIPNRIEIPKQKRIVSIKLIFLFLITVLIIFGGIFLGFYLNGQKFDNKNVFMQKKPTLYKKTKETPRSVEGFNMTIQLENTTIPSKSSIISTNATRKAYVSNNKNNDKEGYNKKSEEIKSLQKINATAAPQIKEKKPEIATKACYANSTGRNISNLETILGQRGIKYSVKAGNNLVYYSVKVGGLNKNHIDSFVQALKSKGYKILDIAKINDKYYAVLSNMNENQKNRFLYLWKSLGFEILVDKKEELSNKYKVYFYCTKSLFDYLRSKNIDIKTGRGAAW